MQTCAAFVQVKILLWSWLATLTVANGARILAIFPIAGKSHFSCNEAMMRSLYDAGHQITFVSPFPDEESLKNYTVVDTRRETFIYIGQSSLKDFQKLNVFQLFSVLSDIDEKYCHDVLSTKEIQNLINSKEKKYDVMFVELLMMFPCLLPLAEKLNIPVIGTVTLRSWSIADPVVGNPNNPAVIPGEFTHFSDQMTFMERLENVLLSLYVKYQFNFVLPSKLNEIYEKYYTTDLVRKKRISLVFTNNHFSVLSRPNVPNVIDVGGIHLKPVKPLPQDYQNFLDQAEHGVIVFSFGSVMKSSTMDEDMKASFRDAFAEIPQRVIWKFEEPIENLTDNVMLTKWMPQRDILAHKNVKAFISHCGMSGSYEALSEGVPMILMPLFGDQRSNAALLQRLGVGVRLDVLSMTKRTLLDALNTIVNDTKYRDTMKEVSARFKDRPMSPQESIVYWTEYVIRHNGALHMTAAGADMPFYQYFHLDIFAVVVTIVILSSYIILKLAKRIGKFFRESTKYWISIDINKKII